LLSLASLDFFSRKERKGAKHHRRWRGRRKGISLREIFLDDAAAFTK
jgi:hypothetical protein